MLLIGISGCTQEATNNDETSPTTTLETNDSGYPDVEGRYALNTSGVTWECSDGTSGTSDSIAVNVDIFQNGNTFILLSTSDTDDLANFPGFYVTEENYLTGLVQENADFSGRQSIAGIWDQYGASTITYDLNGTFAADGWSGKYSWRVSYTDFNMTCDNATTFTGDIRAPLKTHDAGGGF